MKKDLKSKVLKYSAIAGAAATVSVAKGQVLYTDINDTTVSTNGGFYDLDLNQDGEPDFRITQIIDSGLTENINAVLLSPFDSTFNKAVGETQNGFNYPQNVTPGTVINGYQEFRGIGGSEVKGYMAFEVDGISYPNSNWVGPTTNGFLGLQLRVGDSIHFGWARIDVAQGSNSFTVKDFAVELTPGDSILAGGNILNIAELISENVRISAVAQELNVTFLRELNGAQFILTDIAGRILFDETLSQNKTFDISHLAEGMYVATLQYKGVLHSQKIKLN